MWILEEALGITALRLHAYSEDPIDPEKYQRAVALIERRASREPLQYVLGSQEFCGLDLVVKPGVLIPRPESELLVEEAIALLGSHPQPVILDVGTGSGCLAISVALALPRATSDCLRPVVECFTYRENECPTISREYEDFVVGRRCASPLVIQRFSR